jgi:SAM-dependent methyltransferase
VDVARVRFNENTLPAEFIQADIGNLPFTQPVFDLIFSEGVLHHTDSTEKSLKELAALINPGGYFLFYVYRKKAPIREFCDDYIREKLTALTDEEAWKALIPLSKLGQSLGELDVTITVPEDVPILEIPAGTYDLQRFFYWYVFKAFYRKEYSLDEINHINFDWYRPSNCHRHTEREIQQWCLEAGLHIEVMNVEEAGITVVAQKLK